MVLDFNRHQKLSSSQSLRDISPESWLSGPDTIRGLLRPSIQRFLHTPFTLLGVRSMECILFAIPLAFLLSLVTPLQNSRAQAVDSDQTAPVSLKQLSLEQLGNLEVTTVSKEPQTIQRTAAAIYVLTQDDIRRSGATSIPEVLRLVPGVEVARVSSNSWAVGIRGFGSGFSKSVLVMIDGRSVSTPLFAGVEWNVQNLLLEDVERIEVIRGPGGTIWGSNAVNGVINIITKNAKDTHGELASAGGGSVDQGTSEFRYGGRKTFDYRVYVKAFTR